MFGESTGKMRCACKCVQAIRFRALVRGDFTRQVICYSRCQFNMTPRLILLLASVACGSFFPTPTWASDSRQAVVPQMEQHGPSQPTGSKAMAFISDVKQTIWEIPEPATLLLLGTGLAAASRFMQRRRA